MISLGGDSGQQRKSSVENSSNKAREETKGSKSRRKNLPTQEAPTLCLCRVRLLV